MPVLLAFASAGVYGKIELVRRCGCLLMVHDVGVRQEHTDEGLVKLHSYVYVTRSQLGRSLGDDSVCGRFSIAMSHPINSTLLQEHVALTRCAPVCGVLDAFRDKHGECMFKCSTSLTVEGKPILWNTWDSEERYGAEEQPLYELTIWFVESSCEHLEDSEDNVLEAIDEHSPCIMTKTMSLGLRHVQLVQENLSDGESFYVRLNGKDMYLRGANVVPLHLFEEQVDAKRIHMLIKAAKDANMNAIRVWGGGRYLPDLFYRECDREGILLWHDLMFACAMYPTDQDMLKEVAMEVHQQVIRLSQFASVTLFGFNNEAEASFEWFDETLRNPGIYIADYLSLYISVIL